MKAFIIGLALLFSGAAFAQAPAGYTHVFGNYIVDAAGSPLASGTITFTPTDQNGNGLTLRLGTGGQIMLRPVTTQVTNGTFSVNLADVSLTSPSYGCYSVSAVDNTTGSQVLGGSGMACIQPTGHSYTLDAYAFSTTPILPPANATMNGDLDVVGNINLTGNLIGNISSLISDYGVFNTLTSGASTFSIANGVINPMASQFAGADLSAKITSAISSACSSAYNSRVPATGLFATGCYLKVPAGSYSVTGEIVLPPSTDVTLDLTDATITYAAGVKYGLFVTQGTDHATVIGGLLDFSQDAAAKGGVVLGRGSQGILITGVRETGVVNGDGLLNLGANVVSILHNTFTSNMIGIHLLGSPGYASNANLVEGNIVTGNSREAIVDGDITQYPVGWPVGDGGSFSTSGTSTPNFNNTFRNNDLEINGGASTSTLSYPPILIALTNGDTVEGNYFEASGAPGTQIRVGCQPSTDPTYQSLYNTNGANCGTAVGTTVKSNYFTTSGGSDVEINAGISTTVENNSDNAVTANSCFVNVSHAAIKAHIANNAWSAGSEFCQGGAAENPDTFAINVGPNLEENAIATAASTIYLNANGSGQTTNSQMIRFDQTGPPTPNNPSNNVTSNTKCTPAWALGSMWIDGSTGQWWQCLADSQLTPAVTDGQGTWVRK